MAGFRQLLKSEILRATVSSVKSSNSSCAVELSQRLLTDADLIEHEKVQVWHAASGRSFEGYVLLKEESDANGVGISGPVTQYVHEGDEIEIAAFVYVPEFESGGRRPKRIDLNDGVESACRRISAPLFYSTQKTV